MRWMRTQERVAKWLSLSVFSYLLTGLIWVQATQWVFRWRAERLVRDVAAVAPGQAGWAEFQKLQARWGSHAVFEGQCTPEHCDYVIHLSVPFGFDWIGPELSPWAFRLHQTLLNLATPALIACRAHVPSVQAQVAVRNGQVETERIRFYTDVPKGSGPGWRDLADPEMVPYSSGEYTLIAGYEVQGAHLDRGYVRRIPEWPEPDGHPESMIWRPGGCTVCLAFAGVVTPYTPAAERAAMTTINLDCLTGWTTCVDEQRMMPGVWQRTMEDDRLRTGRQKRLATCDYTVAERVAAAENVVLVRVIGQQPGVFGPEATVKVLERRKGSAPVTPGGQYVLQEMNDGKRRHPQDFAIGRELMVMFETPAGNRPDEIEAYQCGVEPLSADGMPGEKSSTRR